MVPIAPGVGLTKVRRIDHPNGNILHALKSSETSFVSFGEAYFSQIMPNCIKGWKKHTEMTLNIVVPVGDIKFYFAAEIEQSYEPLGHISIGDLNYQRLTIAPGVWIAFECLSSDPAMLLNIASIEHDPNEAINMDLKKIPLSDKALLLDS